MEKCRICDKEFKGRQGLAGHLYSKHGIKMSEYDSDVKIDKPVDIEDKNMQQQQQDIKREDELRNELRKLKEQKRLAKALEKQKKREAKRIEKEKRKVEKERQKSEKMKSTTKAAKVNKSRILPKIPKTIPSDKLISYGLVAGLLGVLFAAGFMFMAALSQLLLPLALIIIPIICALIPTVFFLIYWSDMRRLAPEGIIFKNARKLRQKGVPAAVIRVIHGDNAIKYGLGKKQSKGDEITWHLQQYGIKFDPTQLSGIETEHTFDGVPIVNYSPTLPSAVDGLSALAVQELINDVRQNYPQLNYLSDLELTTLLAKEHDELVQDAHCFVDENDGMAEPELVQLIEEIQEKEGEKVIELNPHGKFFVYNRALAVINNAHSSQLLQQFEMLVKRLAVSNIEKFNLEKLLVFAFAALMVMIGGGVALKLAGVF